MRHLPADLAAVVGAVALVNLAAFAPVVRASPVRVALGLAFVLFVPGYVLVAVLFPESGDPPAAAESSGEQPVAGPAATARRGVDGVERAALSFGLSIAVVALLGLALDFTPWGIRLVPIMTATSGLVLAGAAIAAARRFSLPADERFRVPYRAWLRTARSEVLDPDSRVDAGLNVLLAFAVVLAVASVSFAVLVPPEGERFTAFYVLTEGEDGNLVASGYPTEFERGEASEVVLGIDNRERERTDYTAVVAVHRVDRTAAEPDRRVADNDSDGPPPGPTESVTERRELSRHSASLAHNETWLQSVSVAPDLVGEDVRLTFLLYRGDAPPEPTAESAYRTLYLWVNVPGDG